MIRRPPTAPRPLICAVLAATAALLVGCGDDGSSGSPTTSTAPPGAEGLELGPLLAALEQRGIDRPRPIAGDWKGSLHQADVDPFPIRVRIASLSDPERNVVRYGGEIGCTGTWRFLGGEGRWVHFREVIDRGAGGRCKGSGTVDIAMAAVNLLYRFHGGGIESRGLLHRAG